MLNESSATLLGEDGEVLTMILFLPTPWLPRRRTCSPISSRSVAISRINAVCCELLFDESESVAASRTT